MMKTIFLLLLFSSLGRASTQCGHSLPCERGGTDDAFEEMDCNNQDCPPVFTSEDSEIIPSYSNCTGAGERCYNIQWLRTIGKCPDLEVPIHDEIEQGDLSQVEAALEKTCNYEPYGFCCSTADKVDGNYGQWTEWGQCSRSCGVGKSERNRTCDSPTPKYGGKECIDDAFEEMDCNNQDCPPVFISEDSEINPAFSNCTGAGERCYNIQWLRTNGKCPDLVTIYDEVEQGDLSRVEAALEKTCNYEPYGFCCSTADKAIHGGWSSYGPCSRTCKDNAVQTRTCTNPEPKYGGNSCSGSSSRSCNQNISCAKEAKLDTYSGFTLTPGAELESGCSQPEEMKDGMFSCTRDGSFCHVICLPGFKLETSSSDRYIECINGSWIDQPDRFKCVPDCANHRGKSHSDCQEGSAYFIAGGDGTGRDISVYHPTVDKVACSISPPTLNNKWQRHTTFYHLNTIHLCGGDRGTASTCISHNKDMAGWKKHTLTTGRHHGHSSVVLHNILYIIGGRDSSAIYYAGAESTPLPLTDTPVLTPQHNLDYKGVNQCTATIDEDTLVITGGGDDSSDLTTVATYNVKTRTYTQLPSLKQGRYYHGCGVLERGNTKWIIVAGGANGVVLQSTEMLQLGGSEWTPMGNLNVARVGHSMAVTQRGVMVMGGYTGSGYLSSVELLDWDSAGKTWSVVQPSLNKPRYGFGGAVEIPASMFGCTG